MNKIILGNGDKVAQSTQEMVATLKTQNNFYNKVKEYLTLTTNYTTYYKLEDDSFKVEANDDYIKIEFYGNQITFYRTGVVKVIVRLKDYGLNMDKVDILMDIAESEEEMWMMYDSVFNNKHIIS